MRRQHSGSLTIRLSCLAVLAIILTGCRPSPPAESAMDSSGKVDSAAGPAPASSAVARRELPPVGLAFIDTVGKWCASFAADSLKPGERVTIVFPDSSRKVATWSARLLGRRSAPCAAAFPQQSLSALAAYDLQIIDSLRQDAEEIVFLGVAVLSEATWRRGPDGVARADLDGDGLPEEASVCAIGEGQLFALWRRDRADGVRRKLWQGYFDWGVNVDVTCPPGEDG